MKTLIAVLISITIWNYCYAPPAPISDIEETQFLESIHYSRYLKEVAKILESDPTFAKKLETADEDDLYSGKLANELDFVSHHIRTKLDELKRFELERLHNLKQQLTEEQLGNNYHSGDPLHGHLDRRNKETFETSDLQKLLLKSRKDLAKFDEMRRKGFKKYEMRKEFDKQRRLNGTKNAEERTKLAKELKEMEEKHKKHEPLHEPGHKAQLEEVWKEQDRMQDKFDPIAFFTMHDVDSDGYWDQNELKALFVKELDKLYQAGIAEDDMREREEEMERMRESAFEYFDKDSDGLISRREFFDKTKESEFEQDNGWKSIDEKEPVYSQDEYEEFIKQQQNVQ